MKNRRVAALATLACLGFGTGLAAASPLTGKFVIGGKTLPLKNVAAFRMRDQRNPREMETYVMVTAKPVDAAAIGAAIDPYMAAINDPAVSGETDYLGFSVNAKGAVTINAHVGGTQYLDSSGTIMGQPGSLVADCKENSATKLACSVKTAAPVKAMDGPTWSMDLAFDTNVLSRPAGKPLAKDGGEPGKALLALRTALGGKDLAKILALLTPDEAESYKHDWASPEENLRSALDVLGVTVPKKPKITGGELIADDHALLEVEGTP
ncbi:MAG: hypothetical protein ABI639_12265, partial [Thermoanaerobaculia bacterium]